MDKVQKIVQTKFNENSLGHFYLLNPSCIDKEMLLENWIFEVFNSSSNRDLNNHPDFLHIKLEQGKQYKWQDLTQIFNFLKFRSIEWNQKVIVISNADKISDIVSNKLLKVLEEPPTPCTFFLLNPTKKKLLQTIESRAIELRVKLYKNEIDENVDIKQIKSLHLQDFIVKLKSSPEIEDVLIEIIQSTYTDYNAQIKLQEYLKIRQTDQTFFNSANYRYFKLYSALNFRAID